MDKIVSSNWQSTWLARYGPSYTSPDEVYKSYMDVINALDVVGHEDIAESLRIRVTPDFCRENAGILAVIRGLSRQPGATQLPNIAKPAIEDPKTVWDQIFSEDPPQGDHWRDPVTNESSDSDWDSSEPPTLSPKEMMQDLSVHSSSSDLVVIEPEPQLTSVAPMDPPIFPSVLTETDVIREMRFALLGFNVRFNSNFESNTLSKHALSSIWRDISRLAEALARLREMSGHPLLGPAISGVIDCCTQRILAVKSTTILGTCSEYEEIVGPLVLLASLPHDYFEALTMLRTQFPDIFDDAVKPLLVAIEQWLEGKCSFILDELDVPASEIWSERFRLKRLPPFLEVFELENGGKAAWIARELGLIIPQTRIDIAKPLKWQIFDLSMRNIALLMAHIRPELHRVWKMLANIYLATSPQMLDIIYEAAKVGLDLQSSQAQPLTARNKLQSIVSQKWTGSEFEISTNFDLHVDIPFYMHAVFDLTMLQSFWRRIATAISTGTQDAVHVQIEAMALDQEVCHGIENLQGLDRLV